MRSLPLGTGRRDIPTTEPPPNGSLCHPYLGSNVSALHPLFLEHSDLLITSHSLSLAGEWHLLDRPRLERMVLFVWRLSLLGCLDSRLFCTTESPKTLGKQDRDTLCKILRQVPAVAHLSGLWSAFLDSRRVL